MDTHIDQMTQSNSQMHSGSSENEAVIGDESQQDLYKESNARLKKSLSKLLEPQRHSLASLEKAFFARKNIVLADQKGIGKRVTITAYLYSLKIKHRLNGQFLIVT